MGPMGGDRNFAWGEKSGSSARHAQPLPLILMSHFRGHFCVLRYGTHTFAMLVVAAAVPAACSCCLLLLPVCPAGCAFVHTFMQFTEQSFPVSFAAPREHTHSHRCSPSCTDHPGSVTQYLTISTCF